MEEEDSSDEDEDEGADDKDGGKANAKANGKSGGGSDSDSDGEDSGDEDEVSDITRMQNMLLRSYFCWRWCVLLTQTLPSSSGTGRHNGDVH